MGFFKNMFRSIVKMSRPHFAFNAHENKLCFKLPNDETYDYELAKYDVKMRHDSYVVDAYTLKTTDILVEYIQQDHMSSWNGLSRSLYEGLLKEKLKISMELLDRVEINHYEFSTYKIDGQFILHLVFVWENSKDIFIVDSKGELFKGLLTALVPNYHYKYEDEEKGNINFDVSLVKENSLHQYFNTSDA